MIGERFGRWTVIGNAEPSRTGLPRWECRCDCGVTRNVRRAHLRNGASQSCGCLKRELSISRRTTHGHTSNRKASPEYRSWLHMLQRSTNPNNHRYSDYGGRGITVCESWLSFENFLSDMGPRPSRKHSIDRKNNELGYCKANCRWATLTQQAHNTRKRRNNTSGSTGVCWRKDTHDWMAYITSNGKRRYLGHFNSLDEATAAYEAARLERDARDEIE